MTRGTFLNHILAWSAILIAGLGIASGDSQVQDSERQFNIGAAEWQHTLDQAIKLLGRPIATEAQRETLHKRLDSVRKEALEARAFAEMRASVDRELLTALGPPPKEGEPREALEVEAERRRINQDLAVYDGQIKRADLISTKETVS
jgi:small-conductance mechanosensitive channel